MATSRFSAGGKIVANRRKQRHSTTPYDRPLPRPSSPPPPKSPNWFSGIVVPSARFLASGAGKIFTTIFSESESSSHEDEESASDDDTNNENPYEILHNGANTPNKESHMNLWSSDTKWTIEQLILQETFSREECDMLIKVLNSRVIGAGEKKLPASSPENTVDNEDVDMYSKAVQEAKKWFQEKKTGSSSVAELACEINSVNSTGAGHLMQVETGGDSPVDVARSYMRDRPSWASPTLNIDLGTPLKTMKLFKDGALYSAGQDSFPSLKKRGSLVAGSWNIQEELRRVRSKATEDMLHSPPAKIDPLLFAFGQNKVDSLGVGPALIATGERITDTESSRKTKIADGLVQLHVGVSSDPDLAGPSRRGVNGGPMTEFSEIGEKHVVNGLSSSQPSLLTGENSEKHDEENYNTFGTADELKPADALDMEGNCELLSEAYMEVPIETETDIITSGPQNSFHLQYDELALDAAELYQEDGKVDIVTGKQQTRKSGRNNRRGRGRGK